MSRLEQRDFFIRRSSEVRELIREPHDPEISAALEQMAGSYDWLVQDAGLTATDWRPAH
jgi:hypothetical protein